ncbi:head GIN domain-containing protein [Arenibacter sp. GZD96]|uniref:head GIN domain-containing protein n=1 Tax=Aurantibrevibacter litoralis TaxID=3106030 RepID=UPI002AFDD20E|nr:head GIN domain-containing protein [Arenibacter sp. GZD-96]MEA1787318.1 head GIN domain-containing protein [Arenibacter sp. GZD-96]
MKRIVTIVLMMVAGTAFSQRIVDKQVGNFKEVKVFDLIEVNLIHSDEDKVLIKGKNVDDIQIVNKNGKLKIRMQLDKIFTGEDTFVEVYYTKLDVIDANEGSRITSNAQMHQNSIQLRAQEGAKIKVGLDVAYVDARAVTGGIIEASGLAKSQAIVLNTGGIFEGRALRTEDSKIKISAGGESEIYATESADITIRAGGDVHVYGNPKEINKNTFAGGRVHIKG